MVPERQVLVPDERVGRNVFVMPPITITSISYLRLTVPAVRAMYPEGHFPGLPLVTHLRIEVDRVVRPEVYRHVELHSPDGSSGIYLAGLPYGIVRCLRRLGIRRLSADTLVLVLATVGFPRAPAAPAAPAAPVAPAVAADRWMAQPARDLRGQRLYDRWLADLSGLSIDSSDDHFSMP